MNSSREECAVPQIDWLALARASHYRAGEFAARLQISLRQLERCFSQAGAGSPQAWLDQVRMEEAGRLLAAGHSAGEIIFELSFKDHAHFYRKFRQCFGSTPQQWVEARLRDANFQAHRTQFDPCLPAELSRELALYYHRTRSSSA